MSRSATLAVIGGGWAGLAAAIEGTLAGHAVTLYEMSAQLGGRARRVDVVLDDATLALDNGQHILIGAYTETLRLMRTVGVDETDVLRRSPLALLDAAGQGLRLPPGPPMLAFARAVLAQNTWTWRERVALLTTAARWRAAGFTCDAGLTVERLAAGLPIVVRQDLIDPLCVAALNTPARSASAQVFLAVLHDALFAGKGSADLLLPKVPLSALLPEPAGRWLAAAGACVVVSQRVQALDHGAGAWRVDGRLFDQVVLACSAVEAARLTRAHAPAWADSAAGLHYEPIATVYARSAGTRLPHPMLALRDEPGRWPAQFVFDQGWLGGHDGLLAFAVSGAAAWVELGMMVTAEAAIAQGRDALGMHLKSPLRLVKALVEKRATFQCTPGLQRPAAFVTDGLHAAGDYVAGRYPATLEGAVRSGVAAIRQVCAT